jgi:ribosome biogenesis GTPase
VAICFKQSGPELRSRSPAASEVSGDRTVQNKNLDQPREYLVAGFVYLNDRKIKLNNRNMLTNDQGVVYKKSSGTYTVHSDGRVITCTLSTRFHKETALRNGKKGHRAVDGSDSIAVGDVVRFIENADGSASIVEVLPRRNRLARRSAVPMPGAHASEQVIVSNVDQVVPVFSAARPAPRWNLLDRYLVSAEAMGIPALICITKVDLLESEPTQEAEGLLAVLAEYQQIGYPVVTTSTISGDGMDELREILAGRTSVLVGKSGVGKSSILNTLQPGLGLRVNEVSRYKDRGKHTTTHLELFPLAFGGAVIDTPGTREFGLWDVDDGDLALYFPEMRPFVGQCKFGRDCSHDEEPGCAIRKSVASGQISARRYMSYMRLYQDA